MKTLTTATVLAAALIGTNVIAAPIIIYKDKTDSRHALVASAMPQTVARVVKSMEEKKPDLHEIVVYKLKNRYELYLLSSKVWGLEKITIDEAGNPQVNDDSDERQDETPAPVCPDHTVQFVAISAYPGVAAVNEAIQMVSDSARKKYKTVTILDENADAVTYKNWLSCPHLKGFYSIGHGFNEGIMVGKGDLINYDYFARPELKNRFRDTAVVINSCLVYNYPFGTQIMYGNAMTESDFTENPGPNAYEFVGGHTSLLMVDSEMASACFMSKAVFGMKMDYDTLRKCVGNSDMHYQNFEISQPGRYMQG